MIPGDDILTLALSIQGTQTIAHYRYTGRTVDSLGRYQSVYADPVNVEGSFQPVPRSLYTQYGLDFSRVYYTFYASASILDVVRDISGDKLVFQNKTYQCESANDWYNIDGWVGMLCVWVPPLAA